MESCCDHDIASVPDDLMEAIDQDWADRLNTVFVDLFCRHILSHSPMKVLLQSLEVNHIDASIINQNLNLSSVAFEEEFDENITYMGTLLPNQSQMSPFQFAIYKGRNDIVQYLLKSDDYQPNLEAESTIVIDQVLVQGVSALWLAVSRGNLELASLLLSLGANINHSTRSGSTPTRVAVASSNSDMLELLIVHGADVNKPNKFQNTCLMLACHIGNEKFVRMLIEAQADLDRQALCGATAMHFAAQQGHSTIVKMLLYYGAKFQPNNHGFTPLFVAAESTKESVVHQFFAVPNLTTFEERITACELLGASFATTSDRLDDYTFILEAYTWFRNAFMLRYSTNLATDCECSSGDLKDFKLAADIDPNELPNIAKPASMEPISAYFFHRECRTLNELESIKTNAIEMLYECFVILERILGPKNLTLAEALVIRGAEFADIGQFSQACQLWLRAIRIKINAKVFIGEDCLRFIRVLERMIQERTSYIEYIEQLLQLGIDYYTLRPRLFGYRKLCTQINSGNMDDFEDFTFNDLKPDLPPVKYTGLDLWNKVDSDLDSDQVMLSQLYLCTFVAKFLTEFNDETTHRLHKLVHRLCKLHITQTITGRTLLHLAMSTEPDEDLHYNNRFNNVLIRYPSMVTATFLIRCGADVTTTDVAYNSILNYLSAFTIRDSEARMEQMYELHNLIINTKMSCSGRPDGPDLTISCSPRSSLSSTSEQSFLSICSSVHSQSTYSKCPPYYGGESSVHHDAVNIFGQTALQSSTSMFSDIIFRNSKQVASLKCLAARSVHQRFLFCKSCRTKTGKFELERLWSENPVPNQRYIKLLRYNQVLAKNCKVPKGEKIRFAYLDGYCSHNIVDYSQSHVWHMMNYFAQRLSISLELAQFVEMHGPCKFLHFSCPQETADLPSQIAAHSSKC